MTAMIALMGGFLLAQADATASEDLELQVRRLVRQLDARQLAERDAAEKALLELGPDVLELLPQGDQRVSAEVAQRVARIRSRLERAMAEAAGRASRVTLQGELTLREAAAKIEEQTGNRIVLKIPGVGPDEQAGPKLSLEVDDLPFWQALDRVLDQAGLDVYAYGEPKGVHLVPRPPEAAPRSDRASYSGPFRFEAISVQAMRDLRRPEGGSLRVVLEIAWEPRLAPVSLMQPMAEVSAVDENGEPVPVDTRQAVSEIPVLPEATTVQLEIPLELPPRDVQRIARLQGALTALLPSKVESFRFGDLTGDEKSEKRVAGVTVALERVRENRGRWEIRLLVRFDKAKGALESHRTWIEDNEVYLETPEGEKIAWAMSVPTRQTENEVGMAYYFVVEGPLTGHTLVYKTPAMILSKDFDYELEDIPLP